MFKGRTLNLWANPESYIKTRRSIAVRRDFCGAQPQYMSHIHVIIETPYITKLLTDKAMIDIVAGRMGLGMSLNMSGLQCGDELIYSLGTRPSGLAYLMPRPSSQLPIPFVRASFTARVSLSPVGTVYAATVSCIVHTVNSNRLKNT